MTLIKRYNKNAFPCYLYHITSYKLNLALKLYIWHGLKQH